MNVCLTGGIACGKSLLSHFLNDLGFGTIDADDIVHEIIPDPEERRRLAAEVFADPEKRRRLEARIHPLVRQRIAKALADAAAAGKCLIAVVPLLFEVHWEGDFDIICCVRSGKAVQLERMMTTRGYSRAEAQARLDAQMSVEEKAAKSHYVIDNDGTAEELRARAGEFVRWLTERTAGDSCATRG